MSGMQAARERSFAGGRGRMRRLWIAFPLSDNLNLPCAPESRKRGAGYLGERHMAKQSTQHKLDRVRSPRVQITYDVEVGGAIEMKELPFVMGVMGDFTGQPTEPLARVKDRKFVEVNPDNFDAVLESMKPHLAYS